MAVRFETRLKALECPVDIEDPRLMLARLLARTHPSWNDEDLMHHPADAVVFCQMVRQFEGCGALPDELILRVLSGARKQSLPVADKVDAPASGTAE